MSHITTVETEFKSFEAIQRACRRLGLAAPVKDTTVELFSGRATGTVVKLPGWRYPIVIDPATGHAKYDNYGGRWGEAAKLDAFKQAYAIERTRIAAHAKGRSVRETKMKNGAVKLTINM